MLMSSPGIKSWYPSYMVSPWYCWFVEMGHPNLDVMQWKDGSWAIIEYYKAPIIPSETKWNIVLGYMENVEISAGFIFNWIKKFDLHKKQVWDEEEAKSREAELEWERNERHAEDTVNEYSKAVMGNDDLLNRIAKNGLQEALPWNILKHVPRHQLSKKDKLCR